MNCGDSTVLGHVLSFLVNISNNHPNLVQLIPSFAKLGLVGDFQLMFVYICIPLVGCGGPSGAESSTLSSYSSGIKKSVSQMYAKYSSSNNL